MSINQITTIFFDVDGIFTDGSLYILENGVKMTKFNVHDGMGCILLKEMGIGDDLNLSTLRISFGKNNNEKEIDKLIEALKEIL